MSEDLRYPIGEFANIESADSSLRARFIEVIRDLPTALRDAVRDLNESQIETPYRPEGWTVRQSVHHVADSHMNAFIRVKLALTEDAPTIKPYFEDKWAELADYSMSMEISLDLLTNLHLRWVTLWESMTEAQFNRVYVHPDMGEMKMFQVLALYAWHSLHHTAHITSLRDRMDW